MGQLQLEVESRGPVDDVLVRTLVDEPTAPLAGARVRLPRLPASIQLIENRNAPHVDNRHPNPGTCHIAFFTHDLENTWSTLAANGCQLVSTGIIPDRHRGLRRRQGDLLRGTRGLPTRVHAGTGLP